MKKINKQRKDYLSWDEFFMGVAKLAARRSKDPNTQVGACIVSKNNRILSVGYNGTPNGYDDHYFPWDREGDALETKYLYVVHAERNAILNYRGSNKDLEGAKIYVDLFPCNECAKEIIQVGIKELYYLEDKYKDTKEVIASKKMLDACGVKYTCLKDKIDVIRSMQVGINLNKDSEFNAVLISEFDNFDDLKSYKERIRVHEICRCRN